MQVHILFFALLVGTALGVPLPLFGAIPSLFNGFFFGGYSSSNSEIGGRLFAGGDIVLQNYGVGCQTFSLIPLTCIPFGSVTCSDIQTAGGFEFSLVAGGSITTTNTQIFAGGVSFGGKITGTPTVVKDCPVGIRNVVDLATWQPYLISLSLSLSGLSATGSVSLSFSTLSFVGTGSLNEVFSVSAADLALASSLTLTGIAPGATITINVNGNAVSLQNAGTETFKPFASNIVWNFFAATNIQISSIALYGSILAPLANILASNGVIFGQIFANSFGTTSNGAEINWVPFNVTIPTPPPVPPCGDGIVQPGEQCDLGSANGQPSSCCSATCTFDVVGTICRPAAGPCDVAEVCTGESTQCPPDVFLPITTPCSGLFGICDLELSSHCPGNGPQCTGSLDIITPLWDWSDFNVISFGNYSCISGGVGGRLAVRNNAFLNMFNLGIQILPTDPISAFTLLVAGNVQWISGSCYPLNTLNIGVGGTFTSPLASLRSQVLSGAVITGAQFDAAQTFYAGVSAQIATLPINAAASLTFGGGLQFTCNTMDSLYHLQIDGNLLSSVNWYLLVGCDFSAGWVIDITGSGPVTFKGVPFPGIVEKVVFNVLGSGRLITATNGIAGNILAPANIFTQTLGATYGRVIVGNYLQALQSFKPNCHVFVPITLSNMNTRSVKSGENFIFVVDVSNYAVGDKVCVNEVCRTVINAVVGDVDGDGMVENVLYVDYPFPEPVSESTLITTKVDPNVNRVLIIPQQHVVHNGASSLAISMLLAAFIATFV